MFLDLMVHSAEETLTDNSGYDKNSEAYRIGMKTFFDEEMLLYVGHFLLGTKSPISSLGRNVEVRGYCDKRPLK